MYRKIVILCVAIALVSSSCSERDFNAAMKSAGDMAGEYQKSQGGNALSESTIGRGLKEALEQGVGKGVDVLSARNGFWGDMARRILLPPEAQKVEKTLRDLGLGSLVDKCLLDINHAAEDAATGARPIFVSAITNMTFTDAKNILLGGNKSAATEYLQRTTQDALYQSFKPVIFNSLNKVGALDTYKDVISKYNSIPLVQKVNPDLADHVTRKAMEALFVMVNKEEQNIRRDPVARVSQLLKTVFAAQDRK